MGYHVKNSKRIIVGITGATGVIYGIKLLEALKQKEDIETHLIISEWSAKNIELETNYCLDDVLELADYNYDNNNLAAKISSGSFRSSGMIVIPCSMKTLSAISSGFAYNLIARVADVMLKEHHPLILVPRETPLNVIHLENMNKLARIGVHIMPPMPSFYHKPKTIDDLLDHFTGRVLDLIGIEHEMKGRWGGE